MSKKTERAVVKAAMRLHATWDGEVIIKTPTPDTFVWISAGKRVLTAMKILIRACRTHAKATKKGRK